MKLFKDQAPPTKTPEQAVRHAPENAKRKLTPAEQTAREHLARIAKAEAQAKSEQSKAGG